ncbi:MAG: SlyX family protein [Rhizobiaceae bacterium]|nr:SlyX family protein [Rhizobiaceae bacterium]
MLTSDEERITHLEEEVAHLRLANDELSSEILLQMRKIEKLEKMLRNLEAKQSGLEERLDNPAIDERPPHW